MSVVERVVLKWSRVIKPPGELWGCYMSGISASGDVAIAVSKEDDFGELMLFNNNGKIVWSRHYGDEISKPQLSDDGNTIAVQVGRDALIAYNKEGKVLWTYSVEKKSEIEDYKLSRNGRYAIVVVFDFSSLKNHFVLLRDGAVEWVKSGRSEAERVAISPNNMYIVLASYDKSRGNTRVSLYTIEGAELWSTVVEGFPLHVDVSDNGEVLLTEVSKSFFVAEGHILWAKNYCPYAVFIGGGGRIIALAIGDGWDISVFNREGKLLWTYRGAFDFVASDNYYVIRDSTEFVLVTAEGEVIQRIKISNSEKFEIYDIKISPNGKYFAINVKRFSEGGEMCHLYFF